MKQRLNKIIINLDLDMDYGFRTEKEERDWNKRFGLVQLMYKRINELEDLVSKFNNIGN